MRKPLLSRGPLLAGVCLLSLAVLPGIGENFQSGAKRVPAFSDWTTRHLIYPRTGPIDKMIAAERDPRAAMTWRRQLGAGNWRHRGTGSAVASRGGADWSIYLGQNGTAASQYPAKFGFDVNAVPSCANDFVVFPINAVGSATQPNIVAFNQLYSGTVGGTGICNRAPSTTDTGTSAEVYWSYNVQGIPGGGAVTASPVLSLDSNGTGTGTKLAFVESGSGSAHFHVLAWKAGDGKQASNFQSVGLGEIVGTPVIVNSGSGYAKNDTVTISGGSTLAIYRIQNVVNHAGVKGIVTVLNPTPVTVGYGYTTANGVATTTSGAGVGLTLNITALSTKTINTFSATTPVVGSGTATDLAFGSSTDTLSWPFPDYNTDVVYVGNDAGQLFRIKDVFCMGNVPNPDCTSESSGPAPSIDTTWGTGGFVQVCGGELTAPVYDADTKQVFVGCSDGKLYAVSQNGTIASLQVGDGTTYGGIVDPVLLDATDGFVYAVTGSGSATGGTTGILVQAKTTTLGTNVMVPIGAGGQCNIHAPTPNNAYWTSPTSAGALMYVAGVTGTVSQPCTASSTGGQLELYGIAFGANGTINAGGPAHFLNSGNPGNEWAPLTEFFNANAGIDRLFVSVLTPGGNFASANITAGFPTAFNTFADEGMGSSGIIVDNDSTSAQASSLYFGALQENTACNNTTSTTATGGCAVKLTQAGLQ